ncbi:MAG: MerR family DNA-binding protein [Candidatus Glassbacteria bacterium]|nr:MerR family DNA-binding protein [Candidatus Glassbacteria bacterium]
MESLQIGKVARLSDVGVETIRFYEREGLIAEPPRKESGYRQYPKETVSRIRFIKRAKKLGFSLKEIRELLSLRKDPDATCEDILERAKAKVTNIEEKILALQRMKKALGKLMAACSEAGSVTECPILEALEE